MTIFQTIWGSGSGYGLYFLASRNLQKCWWTSSVVLNGEPMTYHRKLVVFLDCWHSQIFVCYRYQFIWWHFRHLKASGLNWEPNRAKYMGYNLYNIQSNKFSFCIVCLVILLCVCVCAVWRLKIKSKNKCMHLHIK